MSKLYGFKHIVEKTEEELLREQENNKTVLDFLENERKKYWKDLKTGKKTKTSKKAVNFRL